MRGREDGGLHYKGRFSGFACWNGITALSYFCFAPSDVMCFTDSKFNFRHIIKGLFLLRVTFFFFFLYVKFLFDQWKESE